MTGSHEVIELLSSSNEASSSDMEPRRLRRRTKDDGKIHEDNKTQVEATKRRQVRSSRVRNDRRRKRVASVSSESEHDRDNEELRVRHTQREQSRQVPALKRAKVAATTTEVAPTSRAKQDRVANGQLQEITEGMSFYELQAQEQMMARFRAQKRRKAPVSQRPQLSSPSVDGGFSEAASQRSTTLSHSIETLRASGLRTRERVKKEFQSPRAQNVALYARVMTKQHDSDDESEKEESDESDRTGFPRKVAQRKDVRRQKHKDKIGAARKVESSREHVNKARASRKSSDHHKPGRKQLFAQQSACPKLQRTGKRHTKQRLLRLPPQRSSSEAECDQESQGQSDDDLVELVTVPMLQRQEKAKAKKATSNQSAKKQRKDASLPRLQSQSDSAQAFSKTVAGGMNATHHLTEKMSFRELQEQEKLLSFFCAQKRRNSSSVSSSLRKEGHGVRDTNATAETNGSGRRARMGINQKVIPDTCSSFSYVGPPSRNGFSASSAQCVSTAECIARPVKKPTNPVVHSTAWRRLVFEEAPPNILDNVSATPYSFGSDKPLWAYDTTGELRKKCKFVAVDSGIAIAKDNFENQSLSQSQVDCCVRELVEQELPQIKTCHARRVHHTLRDTRKQVSEYLQAHQVLRSERYRRLQWLKIANRQSWLSASPIEHVTAKQMLQASAHTVQPYNHLVGAVRYFVYRDQTSLESLVYPETVTDLPNDTTAIRRSFTMIGIRKNIFVEDDPILRYVPYLGDGERMVVDNDLYSKTTISKERRIAVFGEGEELKASNPSARDDEVMEYLLRIIVGKCGTSDQVFLALEREVGFAQPRSDYYGMKDLAQMEQRVARRIAKVKKLVALEHNSSQNEAAKMSVAQVNASKVLRNLAQPYWFLREKPELQSLAIRLQPPLSVFESSYADSAEVHGIRDRPTYDGLAEWYRDLFCRRCYTYDCPEHGIQNPQRSIRADPIYPMVNRADTVDVRQEVLPIQESDTSAEDGSPDLSTSQGEVIELTGNSSSDDKASESKDQQPSVAKSTSQSTTQYRRSRRTQTRISSLSSKSLQTQEKMLEAERLAELEKRKKHREKFARAADKSEYLDNSYLPAVTASLKKLLPETQSCGSFCWLSARDVHPKTADVPLGQADAALARKLASTLGPNPCMIAAMLRSPRCLCVQISRFLAEEKWWKDSGNNLGAEYEVVAPMERQRKGRRSTGVGSNRSLAERAREKRSYDRDKRLSYKPCDHDGVCGETCECMKRGHSCNKACSCSRDCPNRFHGCKCSIGNCHTSACPCWSAGRECDPDYCFHCGASDAAVMAFYPEFKLQSSYTLNICHNVNMLRGSIQKKVGIAFSAIHGWGVYALEPIRKDEFVFEYTGELITDDEAERRGAIYDRKSVSYLFGVNSDYVVDAARKGNKAKFANHKAKDGANLDVKITVCNGEHRIGLFARKAIEVGAEVFFDYGYTHDTAPKWSQHDKLRPEKRAYDIVDDENEWE